MSETYFGDALVSGVLLPDDSIRIERGPVRVNSLDGRSANSQYRGNIASDSAGNFAAVWIDNLEGLGEAVIQFYKKDGTERGGNIRLANGPYGTVFVVVAANARGNFVVCFGWNYQLYAQWFSATGLPSGSLQTVAEISGGLTGLSVGINKFGRALVMYRTATIPQHVFVKAFTAMSVPTGNPTTISDMPSVTNLLIDQSPGITADSAGNFLTVFGRYESSKSFILLQRVDSLGVKVETNLIISQATAPAYVNNPHVITFAGGRALILWTSTGSQCKGRILLPDGSFAGPEFPVFDGVSGTVPFSALPGRYNEAVIIAGLSEKLRCQRIDSQGNKVGALYSTLPDEPVSRPLYQVSAARLDSISFCVLFEYSLRTLSEITLRRFNETLQPLAPAKKAYASNISNSHQYLPAVIAGDSGKTLVLWEDRRNQRRDTYAQIFDKNLIPLGKNLPLNDTLENEWYADDKSGVVLSDGTFMVVYAGAASYNTFGLYLQKVSPRGEKIGQAYRIATVNGSHRLLINRDSEDNILVVWYPKNNVAATASLVYLKKDWNAVTYKTDFFKLPAGKGLNAFSMSINSALEVFAVWNEFTAQNTVYGKDIFGRVFDRKGEPLAATFVIDTLFDYQRGSFLTANKLGNGKTREYCVIARFPSQLWCYRFYDHSSGKKMFRDQVIGYEAYGLPPAVLDFNRGSFVIRHSLSRRNRSLYSGNDFQNISRRLFGEQISVYRYAGDGIPEEPEEALVLNDSQLVFAYDFYTEKQGNDVYIASSALSRTGNDLDYLTGFGKKDLMLHNYPNPFNGSTKIVYAIRAPIHVKITVHDILGREVAVLVNESRGPGSYQIDFNARDLPSGVYFIRMDAFETEVRKMLLLR